MGAFKRYSEVHENSKIIKVPVFLFQTLPYRVFSDIQFPAHTLLESWAAKALWSLFFSQFVVKPLRNPLLHRKSREKPLWLL